MKIERVTEASPDLVAAIAELVPQLTSSLPPTAAELEELLAADLTHLLVARNDAGAIVGSLTFVMYRKPTGLDALIEDVVVDAAARGQGVGEALVLEAQRIARESGVKDIWLTSRSERVAANRLYQRLGFERRETNVYVWRPR
ncbi:MAG TPA: GNAT family N-acetyltransferase [Gaiellaceae bacterium]|jgi:ribosomal protein S18 acetylase RimI-like enzyme